MRVACIDAPEIFRPKCEAERAFGNLAKMFLEERLPSGTAIRLDNVTTDPFPGREAAIAVKLNDRRVSYLGTMMLRESEIFRAWEPGDEKIDWCGKPYWNPQMLLLLE